MYVIGCQDPYQVVTIPGTAIISPNYPNGYEPNLNCHVTITFDHNVAIAFEEFHTWSNEAYLEIRDGNSLNSDLIDKISGRDTPSPIAASGKSMTLIFHSTSYVDEDFRGFKLRTVRGKS